MKRLLGTVKDHPPYWAIYYRQLVEIVDEIKKAPYDFVEEIKKLPYTDFVSVYQEFVGFSDLPEEVENELETEYVARGPSNTKQ